LPDLYAAIEGWNEAQGGTDKPEPMTRDEYEELKAYRRKLDRKARNGTD
jgi:hypothetical protein